MYLATLKEQEKELFLSFAYALSSSDNDFGTEEHAMIDSYCEEMQFFATGEISSMTIEETVEKIKNISDEKAKKVIIFELVGLALSDSNFDEKEHAIIDEASVSFGLDKDYAEKCKKVIEEYLLFQQKINELVLN